MTTSTLREFLKNETSAAHRELDESVDIDALSTLEGYKRFLLGHARAVIPLEVLLDRSGAERVCPDWSERRRGSALRSDLQTLGAEGDFIALPPEPVPDAAGDSPARLLGIMYVLEGSRLGNRFLLKELESQNCGFPLSYLRGGGARSSWSKFLELLEDFSGQREQVLEGSHFAFNRFLEGWIREQG